MHRRRECVPRLLVSFWPVSGSKNRVIVSISSYAVKSNMFPHSRGLSAIVAPDPTPASLPTPQEFGERNAISPISRPRLSSEQLRALRECFPSTRGLAIVL